MTLIPITNKLYEDVTKRKRTRKRHVIWYNPPFSIGVKTDIGRKFLKIIDKCFDKRHPLRGVFNRTTVKMSYETTPNLQQIIASHNKKLISKANKTSETKKLCSCRKGDTCPLDGKCLSENIIYQATITPNSGKEETYIGLTSNKFKTRLANHKAALKNKNLAKSCKLAEHVGRLRENNNDIKEIKWKILGTAPTYSSISNICSLCIKEKSFIIYNPE